MNAMKTMRAATRKDAFATRLNSSEPVPRKRVS
jgi:hypothetical protein